MDFRGTHISENNTTTESPPQPSPRTPSPEQIHPVVTSRKSLPTLSRAPYQFFQWHGGPFHVGISQGLSIQHALKGINYWTRWVFFHSRGFSQTLSPRTSARTPEPSSSSFSLHSWRPDISFPSSPCRLPYLGLDTLQFCPGSFQWSLPLPIPSSCYGEMAFSKLPCQGGSPFS